MPETAAHLKHARVSPQKMRLVIDQIRGKRVEYALEQLNYSQKSASYLVKKLLESAIANAENNQGADIDDLVVKRAYVNEGPTLKRMRARAKGRGNRILKHSSHVTIVVEEHTKSENT